MKEADLKLSEHLCTRKLSFRKLHIYTRYPFLLCNSPPDGCNLHLHFVDCCWLKHQHFYTRSLHWCPLQEL